MDVNSETNLWEPYRSSILEMAYDGLSVDSSPQTCAICHRSAGSFGFINGFMTICGDCKYLFQGDLDTNYQTHQFSQIINIARQTDLDHDDQSVDGDGAARSVEHSSYRTTPVAFRRWRRVVSDTESDGFDSLYGETESNVSLRRYRFFHGDTDTISYSAYGGDSDVSVDGQIVMGNDIIAAPDERTEVDSDTDIDPMNAGLYHWNSDDEDESEWEETEIQGNNTVESSYNVNNRYVNVGDYLNARGFENLLEHLAETENSTRGAPPASESFVKNMKHVENKEENVSCAICKDLITVGAVVNRLPCSHLYHSNCILPWLSARNTCPLCRYELPTDDMDYEESKRSRGNGFRTLAVHRINVNEDSRLDAMNDLVADQPQRELHNASENGGMENRRNRWFFLAAAAAPIVSVVGISLLLWFGKPSTGRWISDRITYRRDSGRRKWWSLSDRITYRRESGRKKWWPLF